MKNVYIVRKKGRDLQNMIQMSHRRLHIYSPWASKYTNSRKRSVNLYKSYQYIFVPCVKMVRMGRGWFSPYTILSSRAYYTMLNYLVNIVFHLIKVKDKTLQHWAREFAPDLCNYCTHQTLLITIYNSLV